LPSCLELARELGNAGTSIQSRYNRGTLLGIERWRSAELFARRLGSNNSRLGVWGAVERKKQLGFCH
jgi:hypothetical protein